MFRDRCAQQNLAAREIAPWQAVGEDRAASKVPIAALKQQYGALFDSISEAPFEADLVGINFETNRDEYDPEVGTIIPRLRAAGSADDVRAIVYEEFCGWFNPIEVGPKEKYTAVSAKIWSLWCASINRTVMLVKHGHHLITDY